MGVSNSTEMFQEKMIEMFHKFEFIQAYINDLSIITKGDLSDLLENFKQTLKNLTTRFSGILKDNYLEKLRWNIQGNA